MLLTHPLEAVILHLITNPDPTVTSTETSQSIMIYKNMLYGYIQ